GPCPLHRRWRSYFPPKQLNISSLGSFNELAPLSPQFSWRQEPEIRILLKKRRGVRGPVLVLQKKRTIAHRRFRLFSAVASRRQAEAETRFFSNLASAA